MLTSLLIIVLGLAAQNVQKADPGRQVCEARCASCHGADGNGGDIGPAVGLRLAAYEDGKLASLIRNGLPARGMPPSSIAGPEMTHLLKFLRMIQGRAAAGAITSRKLRLQTTENKTLEGQVLGEGFDDMQLRTDDHRVHLLRRAGSRFREVTSETDWPTYNGDPGGNRYTSLTQINKDNVTRLAMTWMFPVPDTGQVEVTPVVVGGMMYVTGPNECLALDAGSGRPIWRYKRPRTRAMSVSGGANRGVAVGYDPELETVYWPTGNPSKEYNGDHRKGDNLYSDCILALERKTGHLKWYYQFTPHDLWDWDATETPVLVDAPWQGQTRKLMLQANRNGFFYIFDRRDGTLLLSKPFAKNLTWASAIGPDGRPVKLPNQEPTAEGTKVCPSQDGATNWFSPSFSPATNLYYVQTFEKCSVYTKRDPGEWEAGKAYLGGSQRTAPDPEPQRILKAIDIFTGEIAWTLPQPGPANSWGGTLTTASGLVIFGEEGGALMVADASKGNPLWSFETNQTWRASPMTYMFDGRQFVAVAAGPNIIAFAIHE